MKKYMPFFLILPLILAGCTLPETAPVAEDSPQTAPTEFAEENNCSVINYDNQTATWIPYMDFESIMYGKTAEEYAASVKKILENALDNGINTIYFHVHPNGDAYYDSEIYPKGTFLDGSYDPLQIFLDIAHSMGISVHAWLNPYRMQTEEQMKWLPDDFIVKKWINEGSPMVKTVNGRWYLNPAYDEITELISRTADEILEKYCVDGIHIDDYFYPTTDTEFDLEAFEASGKNDLADWRRDNISAMVRSLYNTVKSHGNDLKFGISPQGNIDTDYNTQYADVELWTSTDGYADYIVPQIYYGFENQTCPFEATLRRWEEFAENSDVSLIIGLAEYKLGKYDQWAGLLGENEWIENPDIIEQQIEIVESSPIADGYALYR